MSAWVTFFALCALAVLHSVLGERFLLGPLFASGLGATPLGPSFTRRTLRFAWHLTSLAWLALAFLATRVDAAGLAAVGVMMGLSALLALVGSRGRHFAWALFAVGAASALLGPRVERAAPWAGALAGGVLLAVAALHVAWAAGVRWGLDAALPTIEGRRPFSPSRAVTVGVALVFAGAGALVAYASQSGARWACALCGAGAVVLGLRALGDFRLVGLTKRVRASRFARRDDALYTPLCVALAVCFVAVSAGGGR
jgi:hypothetical protein